MDNFSIFQAILSSSIIVKGVLLFLFVLMVTTWALVFLIHRTFKEVTEADNHFKTIFDKELHDIQGLEKLYNNPIAHQGSSYYFLFREMYGSLIKLNDQLVAANKGDIFSNISLLDPDYLERSMMRAKDDFIMSIDHYRGYLATISNLSPFIGLFGTVWGIIHSFGALSQGGGSIELVAPGIAEALVATAVGIGAAIPASWFFNIFSGRLLRQKIKMQNFGLDTLNLLSRLLLTFRKDLK